MTVAVCDTDGKTFQHASSYSYHKKVHSTTDISCNECTKRFKSLKTFHIHQKSHASSLCCANETNKCSDILINFSMTDQTKCLVVETVTTVSIPKIEWMIKKVENKLRAKKSAMHLGMTPKRKRNNIVVTILFSV